MNAMWKKVLVVAMAVSTLGVVAGNATFSIGQDATAKAEKKAKGRLPPYFADIVTEEQRSTIYKIRAGYEKQVSDLQAQLESLREKEMMECEAVLDAEQKDKLNKAREAAAAKKKKKKSSEEPAKAAE
jgi:hypothetical protein